EGRVRRYYRFRAIRSAQLVDCPASDGQVAAPLAYGHAGKRTCGSAPPARSGRAAAALRAPAPPIAGPPGGCGGLRPPCLRLGRGLGEPDAAAAELGGALASAGLAPRVTQVVMGAVGCEGHTELGRVQHVTFRRGADGVLAEDRVHRGVHPMMAERLDLW